MSFSAGGGSDRVVRLTDPREGPSNELERGRKLPRIDPPPCDRNVTFLAFENDDVIRRVHVKKQNQIKARERGSARARSRLPEHEDGRAGGPSNPRSHLEPILNTEKRC